VSSKRIAVLFHQADRHYDPARYVVHRLAGCWREDGHDVVYLYGVKRFVPADVVLVHVNLSVVPDKYLEFAGRYPISLNRHIRDIRKTTVSTNLIQPGDGWEGPVIVKSDLNYAGSPERLLGRSWLERKWRPARRVRRLLVRATGTGVPIAESSDYPVFDHVQDIPPEWRTRRGTVVEKFRPEIEDGRYHIRHYQFLGDHWTCMRVSSTNPIVKTTPEVRTEAVEPHDEVVAWRKQLKMDYGKLDYALNDGEVVLLDANKTTGAAHHSDTSPYMSRKRLESQRRYRAEGLYSCFADAGSET